VAGTGSVDWFAVLFPTKWTDRSTAECWRVQFTDI